MSHADDSDRYKRRVLIGYVIALPILFTCVLWLKSQASALGSPARSKPFWSNPHSAELSAAFHVLLALLVILVASQVMGSLLRRLHQPPVIGELVAGIALGPSLLGRLWPEASAFILPPSIVPQISIIAQVGVLLFMFLVGTELDTTLLRKKSHSALAISHASIVLPLALSSVLSVWMYPRYASRDVNFAVFAAFMGVAMSITAFPVLARILVDRGLQKTPLGVIALSCAAIDDATAWCLLAFVVSFARPSSRSALETLAWSAVYVAVLALIVRPYVERMARAADLRGTLSKHALPIMFVGLLASASITEAIGIHAIFGAFALGVLVPHESLLAKKLDATLKDLVQLLLLPAFFACTGMHTQIGLLASPAQWLLCLAVIAVATAGKVGGSMLGARLSGLTWRDAASIGALMNTRGLMELIVLDIGLELHIVTPTVFAMMVLMAIVTTLLTSPLLSWIQSVRSTAGFAATSH